MKKKDVNSAEQKAMDLAEISKVIPTTLLMKIEELQELVRDADEIIHRLYGAMLRHNRSFNNCDKYDDDHWEWLLDCEEDAHAAICTLYETGIEVLRA